MTPDEPPTSRTGDFERLLAKDDNSRFVLILYVTGLTTRSLHAIANIRAICAELLQSRYELQIVDITQDPSSAPSCATSSSRAISPSTRTCCGRGRPGPGAPRHGCAAPMAPSCPCT